MPPTKRDRQVIDKETDLLLKEITDSRPTPKKPRFTQPETLKKERIVKKTQVTPTRTRKAKKPTRSIARLIETNRSRHSGTKSSVTSVPQRSSISKQRPMHYIRDHSNSTVSSTTEPFTPLATQAQEESKKQMTSTSSPRTQRSLIKHSISWSIQLANIAVIPSTPICSLKPASSTSQTQSWSDSGLKNFNQEGKRS